MKDLMFLFIVLGLITFGMIATQGQYRGEQRDKTQKWERETYGKDRRRSPKSPSPTPSPRGNSSFRLTVVA